MLCPDLRTVLYGKVDLTGSPSCHLKPELSLTLSAGSGWVALLLGWAGTSPDWRNPTPPPPPFGAHSTAETRLCPGPPPLQAFTRKWTTLRNSSSAMTKRRRRLGRTADRSGKDAPSPARGAAPRDLTVCVGAWHQARCIARRPGSLTGADLVSILRMGQLRGMGARARVRHGWLAGWLCP